MSHFIVGKPDRSLKHKPVSVKRSPSSDEFEQVDWHGNGETFGLPRESPQASPPPSYGVDSIDAWTPSATDHTAFLNPRIAFGHDLNPDATDQSPMLGHQSQDDAAAADDALCRLKLHSLGINASRNATCSTMNKGEFKTRIYTNPVVLAGIFSLLAGIALFIAGLTTNENIMWGMSIALLVIGIVCLWNRRHLWKLECINIKISNVTEFNVLYYSTSRLDVGTRKTYKLYEIQQWVNGAWVAGITPEDVNKGLTAGVQQGNTDPDDDELP